MTARRWFDERPWQTNAALSVLGLALIGLSRQMVAENDGYVIGLSGCSGWSVIVYCAALLVIWLRPANVNKWTFRIILAVAVTCRLAGLFSDPFTSTDVYRYAWDGVVQHAHKNPYKYVANDPVLKDLREPDSDLYQSMNRRDYAHTIYPPAAQVLFYLVTAVSPTMTMMKATMVLFEGLTLYGLLLLFQELGIRREQAIVYAWCPVLIWEFGLGGHLDSVAMAYVTFALLFRLRGKMGWAGVFLGLAFLTKLYPLVLFPALWRRGDWKMPAVIAAMTVGFYSIYLSAGKMIFGFLGGYAEEEGLKNGTRYFPLELVQHLPGLHGMPNGAYIAFAALVLGGLTVWSWFRATPEQSERTAFLAPAMVLGFALMLLFSPHYPWYVAWLVPFVCLMPNLPVMVYVNLFFYLCYTALAVGTGPKQYELNEILYGCVAAAVVVEVVLRKAPWTRGGFTPWLWLKESA